MPLIDELRSKYPGYADDELLGGLQATKYPEYGIDEIKSAIGYKPAQPKGGQFMSGLGRSFEEVPGLAAGVGAYAADVVGADSARDAMLAYATERSKKVGAAHANDAQSLTDAWDGKVGWIDFLANASGYVAGQALQSLALGGLGAIGAKALATQGLKELAIKTAADEIANGASETVAKEVVAKVVADAAAKAQTRGAVAGVTSQNFNMELGSIYPDAVEEAKSAGNLDAGDKFRVLASSALAAGVDTAATYVTARNWLKGSKVGMGAKKPPTVFGSEIAGRAAREIPAGMAREGGTEAVQTMLEHYGAGQPIADEKGLKDIIDSAGVGAVGGMLGGAVGSLRVRKAEAKPIADVVPILAAPTLDDALSAFQASTSPKTSVNAFGESIQPGATPRAANESAINEIRALDPEQQQQALGILATAQNPNSPDAVRRSAQNQFDELLLPVRRIQALQPVDDAMLPSIMRRGIDATQERMLGGITLDAEAARAPAQKQAELDAIHSTVPEVRADEAQTQAAVQRAGTLESPSAMALALRGIAPVAEQPSAPAPIAEPRIVKRTADMQPTSRAKAQAQADATGGEIARVQNQNGKFSYVALPAAQNEIQPNDLLTGDGMPYGSHIAAKVRARSVGGKVVEVTGGWVVRPQPEAQPATSAVPAVPATDATASPPVAPTARGSVETPAVAQVAQQSAQVAQPNVGDLVKLTKPGVNGPVNIAGTVTRILPDGRLEVRTQQDGYMKVASSELGHKTKPAVPAESDQDQSHRMWRENFDRVVNAPDLAAVSTKDIERAINYADSRSAAEKRKGWDGSPTNKVLIESLDREIANLKFALKQRTPTTKQAEPSRPAEAQQGAGNGDQKGQGRQEGLLTKGVGETPAQTQPQAEGGINAANQVSQPQGNQPEYQNRNVARPQPEAVGGNRPERGGRGVEKQTGPQEQATRTAETVDASTMAPKRAGMSDANRAKARARAQKRMKIDPERDTLLQALAKMGGISRKDARNELGVAKDSLTHTVAVGGLTGYPFRKTGGMPFDRAREALVEAGYLYGVPEEDQTRALEEAIGDELAGNPHYTAEGGTVRAQQLSEAHAEQEAEIDAETQAEDQALVSEVLSQPEEMASTDDNVDYTESSNVSTERFMREMGFSEQEIIDELANEANRAAQAGATETGATGPEEAAGSGAGNGTQAGPVPSASLRAEEGLTLSAQTPEDLQAKADREAAGAAAEQEEQRALAARDGAKTRALNKAEFDARAEAERKRRADAAVEDFALGQEPPSSTVTQAEAAGQEDLFAKEEQGVYDVNSPKENYDVSLDLFPETLPAVPKDAGSGGNRAQQRAPKTGDVPAPNAVSLRQDAQFPGLYHASTQLVEVGRKELPVKTVGSWADAAAALSSLSKFSVEHVDVLITDKSGKPLAVVGSFKGALAQASVYPATVLAEALRIDGAAHAWMVHNHPGGNPTLSKADEYLSGAFARVFDPSSVRFHGIAAVGKKDGATRYAAIGTDQTPYSGMIPEGGKTYSVPIVERTITQGPLGSLVESPALAKMVTEQVAGNQPGIMFLTTSHEVSAWVPLDPAEMKEGLRKDGRYDRLINSAANAGAGAAIIANPNGVFNDRVVNNIASALSLVDVNTLDSIDTVAMKSAAEAGNQPMKSAAVFSRGSNPFYSALTRGIDSLPTKSADAVGWTAAIKGLVSKGAAKQVEVEAVGLPEWLALQQGKVTKEQVQEFLRANGVQVTETVLSDATHEIQPLGHTLPNGNKWVLKTRNGRDQTYFKTEEEAQAYAAKKGYSVGEDGLTKFSQYQLPGGTNYREVLLTLPEKAGAIGAKFQARELPDGSAEVYDRDTGRMVERATTLRRAVTRAIAFNEANPNDVLPDKSFRSSHWAQPNVLAHVRLNDRTDADGKRVLFVEEIQSDWGQAGKKRGFGTSEREQEALSRRQAAHAALVAFVKGLDDGLTTDHKVEDAIADTRRHLNGSLIISGLANNPEVEAEARRLVQADHEATQAVQRESNAKGVPTAPFVTKTDAWVALALKRVIKMAVDEGYDKVSFITGEQSADRYDLSKQVKEIEYEKRPAEESAGTAQYRLSVTAKNGDDVPSQGWMTLQDIEGFVGKEVAKKIENGEGKRYRGHDGLTLEGLDLKVGGEGMRAFYDRIVPSIAKDVLRKVGGGAMGEAKMLTNPADGGGTPVHGAQYMTQPTFDITPAMRDKAAGGLPLFQRGESTGTKSDITRVTNTADAIASKWANKPDIVVFGDMQDDVVPADVRERDAQQRSQGAAGEPRAFYAGGKVYLHAGMLKTPMDVSEALYHEVLGHAGLRGQFGPGLDHVLDQMAKLYNPAVMQAKAIEYGQAVTGKNGKFLRYASEQARRTTAEEVLAELAQTRPSSTWVKRAIAAIRSFLREHVPGFSDLKLTDAEVAERFVIPARGFIERGRASSKALRKAAFQRATQTDSTAFNGFSILEDPSADEARAVEVGIAGKTAIEAAQFVADNASSQSHRAIAKRVAVRLAQLESVGAHFTLHVAHDGDQVPTTMIGTGIRGQVIQKSGDPQTHIWIQGADMTGKVGASYETVLHELLHAATQKAIDLGEHGAKGEIGLAVRELYSVWKEVLRHARDNIDAGTATDFEKEFDAARNNSLSSLHEMVSWALTNEETQKYLESVKYKQGNLWSEFVGAIRRFLGLTQSNDTALSEVLRVADKLLSIDAGRLLVESIQQGVHMSVNYPGRRDIVNSSLAQKLRQAGGAPKIVGNTGRYTPEQLAAFRHVGFEVTPPTLEERARALWKDAGKKLAQGLVDQFAPVKDISKDAYALLRLSKGASGSFETVLHGGKLKLTDGVYDFDETQRGGILDTLLKPLGGEHHDFLRWVAANRAERLANEWSVTMPDGSVQTVDGQAAADALVQSNPGAKAKAASRERLFTQDDIDAIKTLADGKTEFDYTIQHGANAGTVTRDRTLIYADALKTFNGWNKNMLDMAEQSGGIDSDWRARFEKEFYLPFYRVDEEGGSGGIMGANIKGGAVRQQFITALKGGKQKLNADLLDNTLMNWAHLLDAAAKNRAAKATLEAAEQMGVAVSAPEATARDMASNAGKKDHVVWVMDGGQKRFYVVEDPMLLTALTSLQFAGMKGPMMDAMGAFKRALTIGVTASPFFKIRNLIRDSMQAIAAGPLNYNPVANVVQGWKLTDPKSDNFFRLMAGGGTIHFGTMMEGNEAKRVQALVESGVKASTILNREHKVKAFYRKVIEPSITAYNELGNRGEAINRASLYDQLRKQGKSHAEASLMARDLMDFSMQGSFATIRFLTQVVPFFNARIQGLYKLGRAAKEDPARFSAVIGAAAAASIGLMMAFGDDEDWKKREDWDRNNYWWFKIGGTAFRIPKPFEIGAMATLAERGFELAFDKEMTSKRFRQQVLNILGDNLSMNPIPQLVKPMLDVYANKDSFTGRPIETMGMERLKSAYRFNDRTSMAARGISTAANAVTGTIGVESLSPMQVDQLLRGYFGWLGSFIVGAGDILSRPATGQPGRADSDLWKVATGGMISNPQDAPSRYVSQMYQQAAEIERAYGTWRELLKEGKTAEAQEFRQDNAEKIANYRAIERAKAAETKINEQVRRVERSDITGTEKRERIRALLAIKDRIARPVSAVN